MFSAIVILLALPYLCESCNFADYPRHYIAYRIAEGEEAIDIDGRLHDRAWRAVAWSAPFVDIRGDNAPTPTFETRFKARYDARFLYIGAHMEERHVWANLTETNSAIYHDNAFEVLVDSAGTSHNYREIEHNALNVNWTLSLTKPYLNGGVAVCDNPQLCTCCWRVEGARSAVHVEPDRVNDVTTVNRFWSIEMALPLDELSNEVASETGHYDGRLWRIDFLRAHHDVDIVGDRFVKIPGGDRYWAWQPTGLINIHLPERWGYLQFSNASVNTSSVERDATWPLRQALHAVYAAELAYYASLDNHARYTNDLGALVREAGLDASIANGTSGCAGAPTIMLSNEFGFRVEIRSGRFIASIRRDRFLTVIVEKE